MSFVRPVGVSRSLADGWPLELFGVADRGHRVLSEGEIAVAGPDDYVAKLRAAFVEPDAEARRMKILEKARAMAAEVGGSIEAHADLANTLSDLVEWPGLVRGSFAPEFLELPEEITVTAMRTHQKYLPVRGPSGLLPHFIAVMDNAEDRKGFIAKGSEWVLNARLADARFFFEEDVKERLEARVPRLSRLAFQDKLGDYRQKTERIQDLAEAIALQLARPDLVEAVRTAGLLSKADLTTHVVKEFTDLQGVMGGIYARRERHPDAVWKAVADQYRPASLDDPPREVSGAILSLADRFDSLAVSAGSGSSRKTTACAAPRSARCRSRSRAAGAPTGGRSPARRFRSIPPASPARRPRTPSRSSRSSSPTGCAPYSSGEDRATTRSPRS
jgi:glycyl-tRNA synthetase beta chain